MNYRINRLKAVLAEEHLKNKWLAQKMGKDESTISSWVNNKRQPSLNSLLKIAQLLKVDIRSLLNPTKKVEHE